MPDVTIAYKNSTIASINGSGAISLSTAGRYCEDDITVTYAPNFEDITISQDYLTKQNTVISNGIIFQTDETYPGTPVVLNNTSYANINNGDLGQNGIGIKIDLNKTYHCTGELKIEWSTGEQEIYSIDSDFTPTNYSVNDLSFSWEGIGISTQTFNRIYLNFVSSSANGYKIYMRPTTANVITKSGVLLDGSYYQISVTSDGFNTINLNLSDDPRFQAIYKSLAYRSIIASSAPGVSEWCDNLSDIKSFMFAGQQFNGDFTFNNVYFVGQYAFAVPWTGGTSIQTSYTINFLRSSGTSFGTSPFYNNGMIRGINAPYLSIIGAWFCQSCRNLTTISFPECTSIGDNAFQTCTNLTTIFFPECTSIGNYAFQSCTNLNTISFPKCTTIGSYAFNGCSKLITISFPECTSININAFYNCFSLTTISFPKCTTIGSYAFSGCSKLITISFPECTSINIAAFHYCSSLTSAYFPECTFIGGNAFQSCYSLTSAYFPECTFIGGNAFQSCYSLTTISFPKCTSIGNQAFHYCSSLTSAYFPECTFIGGNAFQSCFSLTTISFPKCTTIGSYAFQYCSSLTSAYFPECSILSNNVFRSCSNLTIVSFPKCTSIGNYAFQCCYSLTSAYFMASSIISLGGTYVFSSTPMTSTSYLGYYGSIYVPSSLLASYKTATNWAAYSSRMVGI